MDGNNPVADTAIVLQLDEIPVIASRAIVRGFAHPDGAAGRSPAGVISLGSGRRGFGEDVAEKGFHDRHTAADEAGVDFDHTGQGITDQRKRSRGKEGENRNQKQRLTLGERSSRPTKVYRGH